MKTKGLYCFRTFLLVLFFLGFQDCVQGRLLAASKPDRDDAAAYARWLVSQNTWGILKSYLLLGTAHKSFELEVWLICHFNFAVHYQVSWKEHPLGKDFSHLYIVNEMKFFLTVKLNKFCSFLWNVVSFSDGLPDKGTGIPYFYLTTLDPTARNALKDQRSSLTISEYPLGTCGKADPESPVCAKITFTGSLGLLDAKSKEAEFAQTALFTKHPEMKGWPKSHNFQIFKLEIKDIFMINWFGGPKPLTVEQYLDYKM
ncbi:hypothetical protein QQP08_014110 [Theobroma cacao]|nr:hypothetical protein QQP08_014110 [Theobroma cacao]